MHQDQRLQRICTSLSNAGYTVNIVGVKRRQDQYQSNGYNSVSLNVLFKTGALFYFEINIRFFSYLLFKKLDGVVANDLDTLLAAKLITLIRFKKLFIDLHEYYTEVPELSGKLLKKLLWTLVGRFGITKSSNNYTVNNSLNQILSNKYKAKFETIYNYPTTKKVADNDVKLKTLNLVYVGVVNKGRGIKETIQAIKNLSEVKLTIIGEGDEYLELINFIKSKDLNDKVKFLGFIDSHLIHSELQNYDIGINILDSASLNYYYSSANKYFDYIMAGLPTISMKFPEYEFLNKMHETSLLLDSININAIKVAIEDLQSNDILRTKLRENCLKAKSEYNWESQETKLLEIFNSSFNL